MLQEGYEIQRLITNASKIIRNLMLAATCRHVVIFEKVNCGQGIHVIQFSVFYHYING